MPDLDTINLPVCAPDISERDIVEVVRVLRSGWIGTGRVSKDLEKAFVEYMGGGYAVSLSSCTMGLIIGLRCLGVKAGDEVITTPLTFCATLNAILSLGAKPVLCDVDSDGLMDIEDAKKKITLKTKAFLPIHYTGAPVDVNRLREYGFPVLEDSAHSFGGTYEKDRDEMRVPEKQGRDGDASVFSLYSTKNITSGEGGVLCTRRRDIAEEAEILSNQGQTTGAWFRYGVGPVVPYEVVCSGYKGNLPDVLAALGLSQIRRWNELKEKREKVWRVYAGEFGPKKKGHSKHLYTVLVKDRPNTRQRLWVKGIGTGVHYEALHLQPAYRDLGYKRGDFPMTEVIGDHTMSLPLSSKMTEKDALRVTREVKKYVQR